MIKLEFQGNISIEEIFNTYQSLIFKEIIVSLEKHLSKARCEKFVVMQIIINQSPLSIELSPSYFREVVMKSKKIFLELEEYELCIKCDQLMGSIKTCC